MPPLREQEKVNFKFFLDLPRPTAPAGHAMSKARSSASRFSNIPAPAPAAAKRPISSCSPRLSGDRLIIANATGCSSIYGGNLPTTPYTVNRDGRGPAWSNSLFEDNAEYGFGHRMALGQTNRIRARTGPPNLPPKLGDDLGRRIAQRQAGQRSGNRRPTRTRARIAPEPKQLHQPEPPPHVLADALVKKSVWIIGGDGWAYDIGFGGLDHVIAMNRNVNILVLDTEVYSNTGGQQSKSTPPGASAKFAVAGKRIARKDLGLIAMTYGTAYVAQVALGAKDSQTVKAFEEAECYPGTSLIIAYSPCIAHGYDLGRAWNTQKLAVDTGFWPLYRFDPRRVRPGEPGLKLDSAAPKVPLQILWDSERRFQMLLSQDPRSGKEILEIAQTDVNQKFAQYQRLAALPTTPAVPCPKDRRDLVTHQTCETRGRSKRPREAWRRPKNPTRLGVRAVASPCPILQSVGVTHFREHFGREMFGREMERRV